jgi:ABC-type branched-subunit amino acid transport system ATPase component
MGPAMSLLSVSGLSKAFGGNQAVDNVGFTLGAGELLALIGPNGAGKSTLFNMLSGQLPADRGSIRFAGQELLGRTPRAICHMGVGRTFQIAETFGSLSALENVQMALLSADRRVFSFWRRAARYRAGEALELLREVGVDALSRQACADLSYGDVKRVELAMAMAHRPRLLLMDEPTAGMAPAERHALMALTRQWVDQQGLSVLFTEHSMDVVFAFADRIVVLAGGQVIADGKPQEVRGDAQVQRVYFGSGRSFEAAPSAEPGA